MACAVNIPNQLLWPEEIEPLQDNYMQQKWNAQISNEPAVLDSSRFVGGMGSPAKNNVLVTFDLDNSMLDTNAAEAAGLLPT
jgi:hypothetical protein